MVTATGYEETCKAAATEQGLDGIVAHLRAIGYEVEVDQTGGFCMVARINNECNDGWYGITNDGDEESGNDFLVYFYEDEESTEGRLLTKYQLELYADVSDRLLDEYVPPSIANVIGVRSDVRRFFDGLLAGGINFHPDTSASEYTTPLCPAYDAAMRQCFELGDIHGFDVYEVAVEAGEAFDA